MNQQGLLIVEELVKYYTSSGNKDVVKAIDGVSFELSKNSTLGVVGESGCGKTTLGKCILGLLEITNGTIRFNDKQISGLSLEDFRAFRKEIQVVFQNPHDALNPRMKIRKLLSEPFKVWNKRIPQKELNEKMKNLLSLVHLSESTLDRYPHQLSGGQLQRISIAMAIANKPQLIILDEPTTSLDAQSTAELIDLFFTLKMELNNSYIFISHDLHAVKDICDNIAVMYLGRIVEMGSRDEIFDHPRHPYTQSLIGSMLSINRNNDEIIELKGEVPSPIHLPSGCYFHSRCPYADEKCSIKYPCRTNLDKGGYVHCWRYANK